MLGLPVSTRQDRWRRHHHEVVLHVGLQVDCHRRYRFSEVALEQQFPGGKLDGRIGVTAGDPIHGRNAFQAHLAGFFRKFRVTPSHDRQGFQTHPSAMGVDLRSDPWSYLSPACALGGPRS
jgi:hypothetical protein